MHKHVGKGSRLAIAWLIAVATTTPLAAQQAGGVGTIEGTVKESNTGRAVEGAQVGITGAGLGARPTP